MDIAIWEENLARLIRAGLYARATTEPHGNLTAVVGVYPEGKSGGVVAKFHNPQRARDAASKVNQLAAVG